jgi:hypothetical protein
MDIPFGRSIVGSFTLPSKERVAEPPTQEQAFISNRGYVVVRDKFGVISYFSKPVKPHTDPWVHNLSEAKVFPSLQTAYGRRGRPPGVHANWKVQTLEQAEKELQQCTP